VPFGFVPLEIDSAELLDGVGETVGHESAPGS